MEFELLSERNKQILTYLISEYILTAEAVGSRKLSKKYINLSSATIRNIMSELEEMGLLHQPHTSAGRIPTEKALRFYVDSILKVRKLNPREKKRIRGKYQFSEMEVSDIVKQTSEVLSVLSRHVGIVSAPKIIGTILRHIEFIKIAKDRILVIFVSQSGFVQNRIIDDPEDIGQDELDKYSNYLNEILAGLSLEEIKIKIEEEVKKEKIAYNQLLSNALKLSQRVLGQEEEKELYIEGQANLLEYPEFAEIEKMKMLFHALEEKNRILTLLDKTKDAEGVQIFIGSENELINMRECSIITSSYRFGGRVIGALGIIGPTRMDYLKLIPIVEYSAQLVTEFLNTRFQQL